MSAKKVMLASLLIDSRPGFASGDDLEDGVFQIRMNNITRDGALDVAKRRRVSVDEKKLGGVLLNVGDVLFNATNSPDLVGKSAYIENLDEPTTYSNHFVRLRADPKKLDGSYLARWLHTQFQAGKFKGMCKQWVNQATVSRDSLLALEIPLPPLPEQRRIAAILDKADALRAKRREALAQLDRLAQSIFVEMFGEPSTNPKRWPLVNLEEYLLDVTNGLTRRGTEVDRGLHIVLRLRDIRAGSIDFSEPNRITLNEKEQAKYLVTPGELLFIRVNGNPEYVGRCALFDGHHEHVFFNDHVMRVRLKSGLESGYLAFFLNRPEGKLEIAKHRKTSAGQHTINQNGLGALSLLLPPPELQQQFLNRLTQLRKSLASHRSSLTELDVLFHSVQHRAFRGTL